MLKQIISRCFMLTILFAALSASGQDATEKKIRPNDKVKSPATFRALFETTKGKFVVEVTREWAPLGADRFYDAVGQGFFNGCAFFRVLPDFVVQFGINGDPATQRHWSNASIKDDPVKKSNLPGTIVYATLGKDSRTTQLFINYANNARLDELGFAPFGRVVEGMDVVRKINSEYRQEPNQAGIKAEGDRYLKRAFPRLDYIKKATIISPKDGKKKSAEKKKP